MRRWARRFALGVLSLVAITLGMVWLATYRSGRWYGYRQVTANGGQGYVAVFCEGWLWLQWARIPSGLVTPTAGWAAASGHAIGGWGSNFGPQMPTIPFEHMGLVDALIRVPTEAPPVPGTIATSSSFQSSGRSVSLPLFWLMVAAGAWPAWAGIRTQRQWRERRRPGFAIVPIASADHGGSRVT